MNEINRTLSPEELAKLQKKFSEIKHSINNALAVMMALSEMSQRRPDYAEKLATTVLNKAPQIVSGLQRSEEHTSELQSLRHLVCRLLREKKKWGHVFGRRYKPLLVDGRPGAAYLRRVCDYVDLSSVRAGLLGNKEKVHRYRSSRCDHYQR